MSGHVIAAAEAAARLKLETYESTFEVEAPGTGRLGVAFRDSSELWTQTPGALHRLGVYPGCLLLRANGRPCGATDESALAALEAAAADGAVRVLLLRRRRRRRSPASAARRGGRRRPNCYAATTAAWRRARTSRDSLDGEDRFIKTLRDHATALEARDLLREAAGSSAPAPHPHVARLVAWSVPDSVRAGCSRAPRPGPRVT